MVGEGTVDGMYVMPLMTTEFDACVDGVGDTGRDGVSDVATFADEVFVPPEGGAI